MLDDFKDSQDVAYSLLVNSMLNKKISHAYLINANNYEFAFDFVLAFVKSIICEYHYVNSNQCNHCNKCMRISDNNYPEVKIIEPDSFVIKKEQLLELQSEFSRTSIEGNYRVYVIKDCDKMNKQASNCLLKFLEEPVPGIVAILLTNHITGVLSTIISRCQVIHLMNHHTLDGKSTLENLAMVRCNQKDAISTFVLDEHNQELIDSVLSFLKYFEENGIDILIVMKNMWYNKIQFREDSEIAFLLILYFYYDVLKCKVGLKNYFFCEKESFIQFVSNYNSIHSLIRKIEVANYGVDMVKFNLNLNLLIDDIVIRLGDCNEYS